MWRSLVGACFAPLVVGISLLGCSGRGTQVRMSPEEAKQKSLSASAPGTAETYQAAKAGKPINPNDAIRQAYPANYPGAKGGQPGRPGP